jgi:hypothetical protein
VKDSFTVRSEGGRRVRRRIQHCNLDVIISVGYRIKSRRGTQFRIWATSTLRDHRSRFAGPQTELSRLFGDALTAPRWAGIVPATQPGEAPLSRLAGTTVPLGCLSSSGDR